MIYNSQKGVSLVITFLIMTVMLAIVLNLAAILVSEIRITRDIGSSTSSLYAAISGAEEALYFDRKQIPNLANRGLCNICEICDDLTNCSDCSAASLATDDSNGCDTTNCLNCEINYNSTIDNRSYKINVKVTSDELNPGISIFNLKSKGDYKNTSRAVELNLVE